jgi:hypothetical protein
VGAAPPSIRVLPHTKRQSYKKPHNSAVIRIRIT